jgi:hypothetical protein
MSGRRREVRLELLLGRPVLGPDGKSVGRLHEVVAEKIGDRILVNEFHIGTSAMLERLAASIFAIPRMINRGYRASWEQLDLSGKRPRLTCPVEELERFSKRPAPRRRS